MLSIWSIARKERESSISICLGGGTSQPALDTSLPNLQRELERVTWDGGTDGEPQFGEQLSVQQAERGVAQGITQAQTYPNKASRLHENG